MHPRITPLSPPYTADTAAMLGAMVPDGVPPIALFRTFAKNAPMTQALMGWGGYELSDALSLTLRDREIVIDRTCARCACEYEWGVHIAFFAARAELSAAQVSSLTHGGADDGCWTDQRDRILIEAVDSLHDTATFDDDLYGRLATIFSEAELLDLMLLAGWYHAISFVANGARVDLEPGAPRFADVAPT